MISKHAPPRRRIHWNGHRVIRPAEPLSGRVFRLRIARGLSVYDLAKLSGVYVGTIQRLESGKPVDKRELPPIAAALCAPLCHILCGEHDCTAKACVTQFGRTSRCQPDESHHTAGNHP